MPPLNHHHLIEGPGGINQVKQAGAYYSKLPIYSPTIGSVDGNLSLISPSKISLLVGGSDVLDITSLGLQIKGPYGLQLTAGAGTGKVLTSDAQGNASWQTASSGTASPLTTKGDLYTYSTANARLGVGVDGQILIADSTQPTGLKWGAAPASGMSAVSIASTNGLAGTSSGGSTPILTLSTTITGLLKGNGTAISAAAAGTDYLAPAGNGSQLTGLTEGQIAGLSSDLAAKAPLASPAFTGTPTAPDPTTSGGIATKGYVDTAIQAIPQQGWQTPTLASGWVGYDSGTTFGMPQFMKDSMGFVHFRGLAKNNSGAANTGTVHAPLFTLPAGYRPSQTWRLPVINTDAYAEVDVLATGVVQLVGASSVANNTWMSISGATFLAEQ